MAKRIATAALVGMVFVVSGCQGSGPLSPVSGDQPLFSGMPADGNGNKDVFDFSGGPFAIFCPEEITLDVVGWGQFHVFGPPNNRNVELGVFHLVLTYTNASGDTWVWRDVGPDHWYVDDDGDLIVTITGRSTASGTPARDEIVVGHVVLNVTDGVVVSVAGRSLGPVDDLACDALT
jgi:hypothetical protein